MIATMSAKFDVQGTVHDLYTHQQRLKDLHDICGYSWRFIAKTVNEYSEVSAPSLRRIALGVEPGNHVRKALRLPPVTTVIIIGGGEIPAGAQVISAQLCECGQFFISNHPRRSKCFVCSPYKGKGKK